MSREIKFRAWNARLKQMFTVYSIDFDAGLVFCESSEDTRHTFGMIDVELQQFTGIQDKNDKPVFEGDIVQHRRIISAPCDYHSGEPAFVDPEYIRVGHITIRPSSGVNINGTMEHRDYNEDTLISKSKYSGNPGSYNVYAEVIGDKYSNPDLLEQSC